MLLWTIKFQINFFHFTKHNFDLFRLKIKHPVPNVHDYHPVKHVEKGIFFYICNLLKYTKNKKPFRNTEIGVVARAVTNYLETFLCI